MSPCFSGRWGAGPVQSNPPMAEWPMQLRREQVQKQRVIWAYKHLGSYCASSNLNLPQHASFVCFVRLRKVRIRCSSIAFQWFLKNPEAGNGVFSLKGTSCKG